MLDKLFLIRNVLFIDRKIYCVKDIGCFVGLWWIIRWLNKLIWNSILLYVYCVIEVKLVNYRFY